MTLLFFDVTKTFQRSDGSLVGVRDFNLSVETNQFISLVGTSGCGKTTVVNLAAGIIDADQGKILYRNKEVKKQSGDRTVVFQNDAIFPWMTVAQNVGYAPQLKNMSKVSRQEIIDKYLALVGLTKVADFYPKQLSGGMKKRVELARAYANNPLMLLMDEPFGSLDVFTRVKMQIQLLNLWELEQKTVLFVTHDIGEAIFLSDSVIVMSQPPGCVLQNIKIPFSRPRSHHIVRSDQFISLKYDIENLISSLDADDSQVSQT